VPRFEFQANAVSGHYFAARRSYRSPWLAPFGDVVVRELYGVQRAMHAQHAMFVLMGSYTADAT
jgi:hypothetical protein